MVKDNCLNTLSMLLFLLGFFSVFGLVASCAGPPLPEMRIGYERMQYIQSLDIGQKLSPEERHHLEELFK